MYLVLFLDHNVTTTSSHRCIRASRAPRLLTRLYCCGSASTLGRARKNLTSTELNVTVSRVRKLAP